MGGVGDVWPLKSDMILVYLVEVTVFLILIYFAVVVAAEKVSFRIKFRIREVVWSI